MNYTHETVLLQEAVQALMHDADGLYVDGTFGRGGHTRALLRQLGPQGRVIAYDRDGDAIATMGDGVDAKLTLRHEAFSEMAQLPPASVAGVLLDLGISSPQIDNPARGFSFRHDGPLDMRMDVGAGMSVAEWLRGASVDAMEQVIREYGEERFAKKIAQAIRSRLDGGAVLERTAQLAQLVAEVVRTREGGQHPATRTFQAFRIFINQELEQLRQALDACLRILQTGGRLVVISFHSLEDRIVKQFIAQHSRAQEEQGGLDWMLNPRQNLTPPPLQAMVRIKPGSEEIARNPRARSAIMRVAERTSAPHPIALSAERRV